MDDRRQRVVASVHSQLLDRAPRVVWVLWVGLVARLWVFERRPPVVDPEVWRLAVRIVVVTGALVFVSVSAGVVFYDGPYEWMVLAWGVISSLPALVAGWRVLRR